MNRNVLFQILLFLGTCLLATVGFAQGPHEVLLLVNGNSRESRFVANVYASLRSIPPENLVTLDLPDKVFLPEAQFSPDEYERYIREPAIEAMRQRNIGDHILAWVYSCDFPVRVTTPTPMSLTGITMLNGRQVETNLVGFGTWLNPMFAGPDKEDGPTGSSLSLQTYLNAVGNDLMPLPAMMLGYSGARGNTAMEIVQCLERGAASDFRAPQHAEVYYITLHGPRSKCREWQFEAAAKELELLGVNAVIEYGDIPRTAANVLGVMAGKPWVETEIMPGRWLDGGIGEHLTSSGAIFHHYDQTKLTEWISHGASGSSGTITEPFALWPKFPNARLFVHYRNGCTLLESYYQSIRSPLQILLVGDPLARPYGEKVSVTLESEKDEEGSLVITAHAEMGSETNLQYLFLLNGQRIRSEGEKAHFPKGVLPPGFYSLRAVVYAGTGILQQGFEETYISVGAQLRDVQIVERLGRQVYDAARPTHFDWPADVDAARSRLLVQDQVVVLEQQGDKVTADLQNIGPGPVAVRPFLEITPGSRLFGATIRGNVMTKNEVPVLESWSREPDGTEVSLEVSAVDPDGDELKMFWLKPARLSMGDQVHPRLRGKARMSLADGGIQIAADIGKLEQVTYKADHEPVLFEAKAKVARGSNVPFYEQLAGLVYETIDEENFRFFGLNAEASAWVHGDVVNGRLEVLGRRGAALRSETWYRMTLEKERLGLRFLVDGEELFSVPYTRALEPGFAVRGTRAGFKDVLLSAGEGAMGAHVVLPQAGLDEVIIRLDDGIGYTDGELDPRLMKKVD